MDNNNKPFYSLDTLHNYTGESYWTHDKKFAIRHYSSCGYWEVQLLYSCIPSNFITRQPTLQLCIDYLNSESTNLQQQNITNGAI